MSTHEQEEEGEEGEEEEGGEGEGEEGREEGGEKEEKAEEGIRKVLSFLQEWDHGDETVRSHVLKTFVAQNQGKTYYELEADFALGASLFLSRLTTWMRLTYMFGTTSIGLQLKAIGVFLSASSNHQYILGFLEDGGVLTLLDILGQKYIAEEDRAEALRLLQTISLASPKYKEMICKSQGVKAVAECLAMSHLDSLQEAAQVLLETLAHGNAQHQPQVYNRLVALMLSCSTEALQRVLCTLRTVQSELKTAHPSIIEPLLVVLRSPHYEVQNEAIGLTLDLSQYELRPVLLSGLVALLKPSQKGANLHPMPEDPEMAETTTSLPVFVQQAAAAKAIRFLAQSSEDISKELLSLQVVHYLLYAMATREHRDTQIQASRALMHFVNTYPALTEHVIGGMGSTLFATFMSNPDTLHAHIDEFQAEVLLSNNVNTPKDLQIDKRNTHPAV